MTLAASSQLHARYSALAADTLTPLRKTKLNFSVDHNLGTLRRSVTDSDTASRKDPIYYKFKLDRRSRLKLKLKNERDFNPFTDLVRRPEVYGAFLNSNGRQIAKTNKVGPSSSTNFTSNKLDKGTYYLKVSITNSDRDADYKLTLKPA